VHEIGHWFNADRYIAVFGSALTLAGVAIAIWQIMKVRGAADAARDSSLAAVSTLRSGSLSRLIRLSIDCRRRLNDLPQTASEAIKTVLRDWVDAYAQILPLLESSDDLPTTTVGGALDVMRSTKATAEELLDQEVGWLAYFGKTLELAPVREELLRYEVVMGSVLLRLEEAEVDRNA
jgi:hypothetical protein